MPGVAGVADCAASWAVALALASWAKASGADTAAAMARPRGRKWREVMLSLHGKGDRSGRGLCRVDTLLARA